MYILIYLPVSSPSLSVNCNRLEIPVSLVLLAGELFFIVLVNSFNKKFKVSFKESNFNSR